MVKTEPTTCEEIPLQRLELKKRKRESPNLTKIVKVESPTSFNVSASTFEKPSGYSSKRNDLSGRVYASDEVRQSAIRKAEELKSKLDNAFSAFVKPMLQSHVTGGFWLGLPTKFCKEKLPKNDETITLVDKNGDEFPTVYLARKTGLSGGWRGFSLKHKLVHGDALVFELVKPTKFKVYIIKAYCLGKIDKGAHNYCEKGSRRSKNNCISEDDSTKPQKMELVVALQASIEKKFENDSGDSGSEVLDGVRFSEKPVDFKDVHDLGSFTIVVDDLIIDSEFSKNTRLEYYNLCRSQGTFLHENLLQGMNLNLVAGVIIETVDIAGGIKASKPITSQGEFAAWDKSLCALETLGMNLKFLRARIQRLRSIAFDAAADLMQYDEAQVQRAHSKEKGSVKSQVAKMVETLKAKVRKHELKFKAEVDSPW